MAVCKECGALNPDSSKFCSACGQPIVKLDSKAIRDAMSQLEAEFEQDALVNLDRSRLTYICDVCGKVNSIDAKQCVRCGKKRPRSEYINALSKIKHSKNLRGAAEAIKAVDEKPAPQPADVVKPQREEVIVPPTPVLPKEEPQQCKEQEPLQMYRFQQASDGVQQNRQIVQPFVIVPYVSQNQPLLQYDPNQIYRYDPLSAKEKQMQAELEQRVKAEQAAKEAEAKAVSKQKSKEKVEAQLSAKRKEQKLRAKKKSSAKVSIAAFLALLVAIAGIIIGFIDLIVKDFTMLRYTADKSIIDLFKGFGDANFATTDGILNFVFVVLIAVFTVFIALMAIQSLIRLFTGRVRRRGFANIVLPLLTVVVAAGIAVVNAYLSEFNADAVFSEPFGWIVAAAVAVALFVLYAVMGSRKKKKSR